VGAPTSWDFLVDAMYTLALANVPFDRIGAFVRINPRGLAASFQHVAQGARRATGSSKSVS
jgi:hypothetical protein